EGSHVHEVERPEAPEAQREEAENSQGLNKEDAWSGRRDHSGDDPRQVAPPSASSPALSRNRSEVDVSAAQSDQERRPGHQAQQRRGLAVPDANRRRRLQKGNTHLFFLKSGNVVSTNWLQTTSTIAELLGVGPPVAVIAEPLSPDLYHTVKSVAFPVS